MNLSGKRTRSCFPSRKSADTDGANRVNEDAVNLSGTEQGTPANRGCPLSFKPFSAGQFPGEINEDPCGLKFTKTDEWVKVEGNVGTVGITDYAQDQLSDVVFVEIMVAAGDTVKKGTSCATIESVKAAADVNTPVSGKVDRDQRRPAPNPRTGQQAIPLAGLDGEN